MSVPVAFEIGLQGDWWRKGRAGPGFERDLEQALAAAIAIPPSARLVLTEGDYLLLLDGGWERVGCVAAPRPHVR